MGSNFTVRLDDTTRLRGQLLRPDGSPAGASAIALFRTAPTTRPDMQVDELRQDHRTDEHGEYDFPVQPGGYRVEIMADGENLVARHDKIDVPIDRATALPGRLEPGLTLRIQTVDSETGQPALGAHFRVREYQGSGVLGARRGSERQTDAQGFAEWDHLLPGQTILDSFNDPTYARFWSTDGRELRHANAPKKPHLPGNVGVDGSLFIQVLPGRGDDPVVIQTERGVLVSGRVLDPDGKPVDRATIHAIIVAADEDNPANFITYGLNGFPAVTATDGSFHQCVAASNGGVLRLVGDKDDDSFGNVVSEPFVSGPGEAHAVTLRLTKGGWVEGTVVNAQGQPQPNIALTAAAVDQLDGYQNHVGFKSDTQGRFRIGPLRPTDYKVRTRNDRFGFGSEPQEEERLITVRAGAGISAGSLHYEPTGWTSPAPEPAPTASPTSAVEMLTARVKIVDEKGQPIAGTTVTPDGLRPRGNVGGGHYFWPVKKLGPPAPAVTDAAGIATVRYPRFVDEKQRTGAISFRAEHPDYCAVRPTNYRIEDPDKVEPVTLHRGATLRISGHLPGSTTAVPIFPQQDDPTHSSLLPTGWKDLGGNVLETRQLPAGRNYVRLTHAAADGSLFFSETKLVNAAPGQTDALDLELRPGVRVEGRLNDSVPRPVRDGKVVIRAFATSPESDANWIDWESWRDVAADGTFVFESLPPGRLEITALCDGYTSVSSPDTEFGGTIHIPQHFDLLPGNSVPAEIKMQPAAVCTVQVRDPAGAPVSGVRVFFAPNVHWTPNLSTRFCMSGFKMEDFVASRKQDWPTMDWLSSNPFQAVSDAQGDATVRNLPAMNGIHFNVIDDLYEISPRVDPLRSVGGDKNLPNLVPGGAVTVTAQVTKKGEQPRPEEATDTPTPASDPAPSPPRRSPEQWSANAHLSVHPIPAETETFSGRIVDETGKGLPGVLVDAWTWHPGDETTTDADGNFRLANLEPRCQIEVRFSKEGYVPRLVVKQPLGELDQPLTLTTHTYFEGVVTDPDGHPAAGAWVRANQGPKRGDDVFIDTIWTETHADAQGRYRLYAQGDRYEFQVTTQTGSVACLPEVELADGETRRLDIALRPGVVFRAKVVDGPDGAPVAGARFSNREHPGVEGTSGPDGTLEIRGLPPGKFEFQVGAKGFTRWWSEQCASRWHRFEPEFEPGARWQRNFDNLDFDLQPGMPPVTITLERGVRIRGRALDPDGKPVGGATVTAARTGSDGHG